MTAARDSAAPSASPSTAADPQGERPTENLRVELEDAATRHGWVSTLGLLAGVQQWHFVALLGEQICYESATFAAPYTWGGLPLGRTMRPREEWSPGMSEALDALRNELERDGWVLVGRVGPHPWDERYERASR